MHWRMSESTGGDHRCLETRILGQAPFDFPNLTVEVAASLVSSPLVFRGSSAFVSIIHASLKLKSSDLRGHQKPLLSVVWVPQCL